MSFPNLTTMLSRVPALQAGRIIAAGFIKRLIVDFAIVGFPKCGNTWYSALLRHLFAARHGLPQEKMGKLFLSDSDAAIFQFPPGLPRLYQTHCLPYPREAGLRGMRESIAPFKNKPMVVLIRDAKDVLTSYFFHQKFRTGRQKFSSTIDDFVRSPVYGIEKFISYYNVVAETRMSSRAPTLITRYEELWDNCSSVMLKNLKFMGITDVSEAMLARAAESCGIEKMRIMELASTSENALVPGLFKVQDERPEAMKVRKGGIGNWRDCLSDDAAAEIDRQLESKLNPFFSHSQRGTFRRH